MPRLETDRFKKLKQDRTYPMSNTSAARQAIRDHMMSYYGDYKDYGGAKDSLDAIAMDAESAGGSTDWAKGKRLAEGGNFAVYTDDQRDFLKKIYVPQDVDKWPDDKVFDRYANLIGREYSRMVAERKKRKP